MSGMKEGLALSKAAGTYKGEAEGVHCRVDAENARCGLKYVS